jgi:hypothetical protein
MNKYHELDSNISKKIMTEFKGEVVDSVCPVCKGETKPKVGDEILWQYTHHLNSRQTTQLVKEGVLLKIVDKKKKYLSDWPSKNAIVILKGNKNNSTVPFDSLRKKNKCEQCNGEGHYNIQY